MWTSRTLWPDFAGVIWPPLFVDWQEDMVVNENRQRVVRNSDFSSSPSNANNQYLCSISSIICTRMPLLSSLQTKVPMSGWRYLMMKFWPQQSWTGCFLSAKLWNYPVNRTGWRTEKRSLKITFFNILFLCKSEINDADLLAFLFTEILHL